MIAMHIPASERQTRGGNVILLNNGREIHLDDIATADQGQAILDTCPTFKESAGRAALDQPAGQGEHGDG